VRLALYRCEAVVENGRLMAIEPDPSHPTGKALCAKGSASPELELRAAHRRRSNRPNSPACGAHRMETAFRHSAHQGDHSGSSHSSLRQLRRYGGGGRHRRKGFPAGRA